MMEWGHGTVPSITKAIPMMERGDAEYLEYRVCPHDVLGCGRVPRSKDGVPQ